MAPCARVEFPKYVCDGESLAREYELSTTYPRLQSWYRGAMRLRNVDFDGSYEDLCDGEEVGGDPAGADDAKFGGV